MYANSPGQFVKINNFKSYEIKFADTFRNCEDGLLVESAGIAILSCDPGREMYNTVIVSYHHPHVSFDMCTTIAST